MIPIERYEQLQNMALQNTVKEGKADDTSATDQQGAGHAEGQSGPSRGNSGDNAGQVQLGIGHVGAGATDHADTDPSTDDLMQTPAEDTVQPAAQRSDDPAQDTGLYADSIQVQDIIDSVGKKFKNKAANILSYVKRVGPEELSWNHKGEILHRGKVIPNSNVIDLIRSLVHNMAGIPVLPGIEAFETIMHNLNVPITLISNTAWKKKLNALKGIPMAQEALTEDAKDRASYVKGQSGKVTKKREKKALSPKSVGKWITL